METKTKTEKKFKAVDFMREAREELTTLYHKDRKRYLSELKKAMKDFKKRQRANRP
jgi:hypothetical protein